MRGDFVRFFMKGSIFNVSAKILTEEYNSLFTQRVLGTVMGHTSPNQTSNS